MGPYAAGMSATQDSPLLDLPAEIRNTIYMLVVVEEEPVQGTKGKLPLTALLRTCQQIRAEAAQIYFTNNSFTITITTAELEKVYASLDAIGPNVAGSIQGLKLIFDPEREFYEKCSGFRPDVHNKEFLLPWKETTRTLRALGVSAEIEFDVASLEREDFESWTTYEYPDYLDEIHSDIAYQLDGIKDDMRFEEAEEDDFIEMWRSAVQDGLRDDGNAKVSESSME